MVIEVKGYSGSPPQKEEVNEEDFPWIIKHNGTVYQIRESQLRNLGIDYLSDVVSASTELGLNPMPSFSQECFHCNNNGYNAEAIVKEKEKLNQDNIMDPIFMDQLSCDCIYSSSLDSVIAYPFENNTTKQVVMAIDKENDCAFYDALISVLMEKGALDPYKVDREFNFPTAEQIDSPDFNFLPYVINQPNQLNQPIEVSTYEVKAQNEDEVKAQIEDVIKTPTLIERLKNWFLF